MNLTNLKKLELTSMGATFAKNGVSEICGSIEKMKNLK